MTEIAYTKPDKAGNSISSARNALASERASILKQLSQMDLENNEARDSIADIVEVIVANIDEIDSQLSGYNFE